MDVVNGEVSGLGGMQRHEWFVVRNKTDADDDDPSFSLNDTEKKLFDKTPWNEIPESRRGSIMLKQYLGGLLCDKICAAFPALFETLNKKLNEASTKLENMGEPRDTHAKRRAHLVAIALSFQKRITEAVERPWDVKDEANKIRKIVRDFNETFAKKMRLEGHTHKFEDQSLTEKECLERLTKVLRLDEREDSAATDATHYTRPKSFVGTEAMERGADEAKPIFAAIRGEVEQCGCTELPGRVHHDVLPRLYKLQRAEWSDLAVKHVKRVSQAVGSASERLLRAACDDSGATPALQEEIIGIVGRFYNASHDGALEELVEYSDKDLSGILQTDDVGFERKR